MSVDNEIIEHPLDDLTPVLEPSPSIAVNTLGQAGLVENFVLDPEVPESSEALTPRIAKDLARDFYQTFRLSQGETKLQRSFFSMLAEEYQGAHNTDQLDSAFTIATPRIRELVLPTRHAEMSARYNPMYGEFQAMWKGFRALCIDRQSPVQATVNTLEGMLVIDTGYQNQKRPGRSAHQVEHESIVREYILGDILPGSEHLMAVRDIFRGLLYDIRDGEFHDDSHITQTWQTLQQEWKRNHPGLSFFPADRE